MENTEQYEDILHEAYRITGGDRNEDYGDPEEEFGRVAKMWSAIVGYEIEWRLVPLMMVALKISREVHKPKRDNRVDGAGYFRVLDTALSKQPAGLKALLEQHNDK